MSLLSLRYSPTVLPHHDIVQKSWPDAGPTLLDFPACTDKVLWFIIYPVSGTVLQK